MTDHDHDHHPHDHDHNHHDRPPTLRIGHSPDPDDAFMWFPLTGIDGGPPLVDTGRFRFEAVQDDIESLNRRAEYGDLEITAISIAQYPYVADAYALTGCGASLGEGYGPKIVARAHPDNADDEPPFAFLRRPGRTIAIPGRRTSAYLAMSLMLESAALSVVEVPFEEIIARVADGEFDAGVVIHEGQLTYETADLVLLADLGAWWGEATGLPLPLGGNAIQRRLEDQFGPGTLREITASLRASIRYAMEHREEAIEYALRFGRGIDRDLAERFVDMYVNQLTLDFGERGRAAVRQFLTRAADLGLAPEVREKLTFIEPAEIVGQ